MTAHCFESFIDDLENLKEKIPYEIDAFWVLI
jgi:hypothetical protein